MSGSFEDFIYNSLCPLLVIACIFVAIILSDDKQMLLAVVALLALVLLWYLWVTYKQTHILPEKSDEKSYLQSIHDEQIICKTDDEQTIKDE